MELEKECQKEQADSAEFKDSDDLGPSAKRLKKALDGDDSESASNLRPVGGMKVTGVVSEATRAKANTMDDSLAHFYEKLFFLKDRLRTTAAKQIAQARHDYMVGFVEQMREEIEGRR